MISVDNIYTLFYFALVANNEELDFQAKPFLFFKFKLDLNDSSLLS